MYVPGGKDAFWENPRLPLWEAPLKTIRALCCPIYLFSVLQADFAWSVLLAQLPYAVQPSFSYSKLWFFNRFLVLLPITALSLSLFFPPLSVSSG